MEDNLCDIRSNKLIIKNCTLPKLKHSFPPKNLFRIDLLSMKETQQ